MRLALFLILVPSLAVAQPAQPSPGRPSTDAAQMSANDCARARRLKQTCVLTIAPEDVEGGVVKPDHQIIDARGFGDFGSLIRIRRDFITEILKSANDVD